MVVFTCNQCGESLKKKDVEKHCSGRCRGPPFLTCVDCLKDFREDYSKHFLCISEGDRYGANGIKSSNMTKQQKWVMLVHQICGKILAETNVDKNVRALLEHLSEYPSIPDKERPFRNFATNLRKFSEKSIQSVWSILNQAKIEEAKKVSESKGMKDLNVINKSSDEVATAEETLQESIANGSPQQSNQKNKSKAKDAEQEEILSIDNKDTGKKKKKRQSTSENCLLDNSHLTESTGNTENHSETTVNFDENSDEMAAEGTPLKSLVNGSLKQSKQKKNKSKTKNAELEDVLQISNEDTGKKKKKRQSTSENCPFDSSDFTESTGNIENNTETTENFDKNSDEVATVEENLQKPIANESLKQSKEKKRSKAKYAEQEDVHQIDNEGIQKKKKKRQSTSESCPTDNTDLTESADNTEENGNRLVNFDIVSKKEKKTKMEWENSGVAEKTDFGEDNQENPGNHVKLTKKEKKEKKKREKYEAQLKEIMSENKEEEFSVVENGCADSQKEEFGLCPENGKSSKQSKKKSKKRKYDDENNAESEVVDGSNTKRTRTDSDAVDNENNEMNLDRKKEKKEKFSWESVILNVLESKEDKEISLKRLTKKVVNEYLVSLGDNAHVDDAKIASIFHKKLSKMHNVMVHKDKVKVKTSRDEC